MFEHFCWGSRAAMQKKKQTRGCTCGINVTLTYKGNHSKEQANTNNVVSLCCNAFVMVHGFGR